MSLPKQVRTTISLPAASLTAAKRAAKAQRVKLSTVVAEALDESLKQQQAKDRAKATFARYQRAFEGFNEEELLILDGIIPENRG
jgi:hypothetical protein